MRKPRIEDYTYKDTPVGQFTPYGLVMKLACPKVPAFQDPNYFHPGASNFYIDMLEYQRWEIQETIKEQKKGEKTAKDFAEFLEKICNQDTNSSPK